MVLPIADLATAATRFFDAELTRVDSAQQPLPPEVSLLFRSARFGAIVFSARPRAASAADYQRLEPAQAANNSYGMADLGRRCPSVWQVTAQDSDNQAAFFYFGALLASVALGPLLVEGHPGLYGVRSARLRCDALDKPDA